jgi:transcriptional regulator with XRE-family HTH domain
MVLEVERWQLDRMARTKQTNSKLRERVAQRVRQARLARGWSQEQLAESLAVSVESVSRYECGKLALSLELLALVAGQLSVPIEVLIGDGPAGLSSEETSLVEGWRRLDVRGKRAVLELVRWGGEVIEVGAGRRKSV